MFSAPELTIINFVFEKCDKVFFAVKPDGVMLHNYETGTFMDLDKGEELLWKYCDGTMTLAEASDRAIEGWPGSVPARQRERLRDLAEQLIAGGFLHKRE